MDPTLRTMARHLVASMTYTDALMRSYLDSYRAGIRHLVLFDNDRLSMKAIIMRAGEYQPDALGFALPPHDHESDTETMVLHGEAVDVTMAEDPDGRGWYSHGPINDWDAVQVAPRPCGLVEVCRLRYGIGGRWVSDHRRVHTIATDGGTVVLLVAGYHAVKAPRDVKLYYQDGAPAPATRCGLYDQDRLHQDVNMLRGLLSY